MRANQKLGFTTGLTCRRTQALLDLPVEQIRRQFALKPTTVWDRITMAHLLLWSRMTPNYGGAAMRRPLGWFSLDYSPFIRLDCLSCRKKRSALLY